MAVAKQMSKLAQTSCDQDVVFFLLLEDSSCCSGAVVTVTVHERRWAVAGIVVGVGFLMDGVAPAAEHCFALQLKPPLVASTKYGCMPEIRFEYRWLRIAVFEG